MSEITIIQINTNRSRVAMDLIIADGLSGKFQIALISEPNVLIAKKQKWNMDVLKNVAIATFKNINITDRGGGDGFAWLDIQGVVFYSCYMSPNADLQTFANFLSALGDSIARQSPRVVIGGDFNAAATEWGSPTTDRRGELLLEWLAEKELIIHNRGDKATFERRGQISFLDLTFSSESMACRLQHWTVDADTEMHSDHYCIRFSVSKTKIQQAKQRNIRWKLTKQSLITLQNTVQEVMIAQYPTSPKQLQWVLQEICNKTFKTNRRNGSAREVYWWTQEVAAYRRSCVAARRKLTRARANNNLPINQKNILENSYNNAKKELKISIKRAKEKKWNELLDALNDDMWGNAYAIATKRMGFAKPEYLPENSLIDIVNALFPVRIESRKRITGPTGLPQVVTLEEIEVAAKKLKKGKAAGPDGVPAEVIKALAKLNPQSLAEIYTNLLNKGVFPDRWKRARLVLVPKPNKTSLDSSGYRPISLLNSAGKLFEHIVLHRLEETIGALSENQHGFRRGRSTLGAIEAVTGIMGHANSGNWRTKEICLVTLLDIKNAFNTASWNEIILALEKKKAPLYLIRTISDYLRNRVIIFGKNSEKERKLSAGIPQGSVLGPYLWNLMFDDLLCQTFPPRTSIVAYADDLALTTTGTTTEEAIDKLNTSICVIQKWLNLKGLELAKQKTEILLATGRRRIVLNNVKIDDTHITCAKQIKYLGVILDRSNTFGPHIQYASAKAARTTTALMRLMPNLKGPTASKRKLLAAVSNSVMLYGAEIWGDAMHIQKYRENLQKVQRLAAIRVCSAYRTISTQAALVMAGLVPVSLLAKERRDMWQLQLKKEEVRKCSIQTWQREWDKTANGRWTYTLIPVLKPWLERSHGELNYHLSQFISGHGSFGCFLQRIGKRDSCSCVYCGQDDTAEHAVLACDRWEPTKIALEMKVGKKLTSTTIISIMLRSRDDWEDVEKYITQIIKDRETLEKRK